MKLVGASAGSPCADPHGTADGVQDEETITCRSSDYHDIGPTRSRGAVVTPALSAATPAVATAASTVVVGLGNDIAGDDGAGIEAARILQQRLGHCDDLEVIALPWAGFALLDVLQNRDRAAIIDCLTTGSHPPGTIVRLDENDLGGSVRLNSFHDINYPTAVALGRHLGWRMPATVAIWGIEAASTDVFSDRLSPPVEEAVQRVVAEVLTFLGPRPHRPSEDEPRHVARE
jgi:hydrogenase maturation protease